MLGVLTTVVAIAGLRASYAVTMPVVAATLIIAAIWPVKSSLEKLLPSKLSYICTVLLLLIACVVFIGAIYFSAAQIARAFAQNQAQFDALYASATKWAARWGFEGLLSRDHYDRLIEFGQALLSNAYTVFVYLGFIAVLVMFGLPEVRLLREKLDDALEAADRGELVAAADEVSSKIRQYVVVTTLTSVITGFASALLTFVIGLDLAPVWGILNFLLNFIPFIGNIVSVVLVTLYAILQFGSLTTSLIVFFSFAVLQIAIGIFVYPALQGRSLSLSPVAVIIALAFWSWLWGVAGALIAIPLTAALVVLCKHSRGTKWITQLLSNKPAA